MSDVVKNWLWEAAVRFGVPTVGLCISLYVLYSILEETRTDNQELIDRLIDNSSKTTEVVVENTEVVRRNTQVFEQVLEQQRATDQTLSRVCEALGGR